MLKSPNMMMWQKAKESFIQFWNANTKVFMDKIWRIRSAKMLNCNTNNQYSRWPNGTTLELKIIFESNFFILVLFSLAMITPISAYLCDVLKGISIRATYLNLDLYQCLS